MSETAVNNACLTVLCAVFLFDISSKQVRECVHGAKVLAGSPVASGLSLWLLVSQADKKNKVSVKSNNQGKRNTTREDTDRSRWISLRVTSAWRNVGTWAITNCTLFCKTQTETAVHQHNY
jgi:hypothetical protein